MTVCFTASDRNSATLPSPHFTFQRSPEASMSMAVPASVIRVKSEVLMFFGRFTCFMRLLGPNGIARSLEPRQVHRAATRARAAAADARPRRGDKAPREGARSWHDARTSAGDLNPPPSWGKHREVRSARHTRTAAIAEVSRHLRRCVVSVGGAVAHRTPPQLFPPCGVHKQHTQARREARTVR